MKKGNKPTRVELDRRVEEVKQALINATTRYAIVENVRARYGVSVSTVDNYIAKAKEALRAEHETNAPYLMAEHIAHRRDLRARARRAGDLQLELKVAVDEAKLQGLYPAQSVELSGKGGGPVAVDINQLQDVSDDDLRAGLAELGRVAAQLAASGRDSMAHDTDESTGND